MSRYSHIKEKFSVICYLKSENIFNMRNFDIASIDRLHITSIILPILFISIVLPSCSGEIGEYEIKYDDGFFEYGYRWTSHSPGYMLVVGFTSPETPVKLLKAKFYILEYPNPFIVRVFNSSRSSLLEKRVKPISTGWFTVDLSEFNVIINEDFYIALEYDALVTNNPFLGVDTTWPDDRSYWVSPEEGWQSVKEVARGTVFYISNADFGIRAVVIPVGSVEIDLNPKVGSVVVDSTKYIADKLPIILYYPRDSTHTIRIDSETVSVGTDTHYVFTHWSDDSVETSRSIKVSKELRLIGFWKKQFLLTIISERGSPAGGGWYDEGSAASVSLSNTEVSGSTAGERYVFTGWSGDVQSKSSSVSLIMDSPKTVYANWKKQYYVKLFSQFSSLNVGNDWYDKDSKLIVRLRETVVGFLVQDVFDHFEGTGPEDSVVGNGVLEVYVDGPKDITAVWRKDYTQLIVLLIVLFAIITVVAFIVLKRKQTLVSKEVRKKDTEAVPLSPPTSFNAPPNIETGEHAKKLEKELTELEKGTIEKAAIELKEMFSKIKKGMSKQELMDLLDPVITGDILIMSKAAMLGMFRNVSVIGGTSANLENTEYWTIPTRFGRFTITIVMENGYVAETHGIEDVIYELDKLITQRVY